MTNTTPIPNYTQHNTAQDALLTIAPPEFKAFIKNNNLTIGQNVCIAYLKDRTEVIEMPYGDNVIIKNI